MENFKINLNQGGTKRFEAKNIINNELQEPREDDMHLMSPTKSKEVLLEDDIYKTEMNNKKPIEIFQDASIDYRDNIINIKEGINKKITIDEKRYDELDKYYLDKEIGSKNFESFYYYNKNNVKEGQSNASTTVSKLNNGHKEINFEDSRDIRRNLIMEVETTKNNPRKLMKFCSSMLRLKKEPKKTNFFNRSSKRRIINT